MYVYISSLSKKDLNANVYLEIARGLRNGCHGICYGHRAYCSLELVHLHFLFFSLLHHLSVLLHITHSCQLTCTNLFRRQKAVTVDPMVFACVAMMSRAIGPKISKEVKDLLEPMLSVGLR